MSDLVDEIQYFRNTDIPMLMTCGIKEKMPAELSCWLLTLPFSVSTYSSLKMDCFQRLEVEAKITNSGTLFNVTMTQENPDMKLVFSKKLQCTPWNGNVYIIETWNGKKVSETMDDHYITILLPSEY